MGGPGSGRYPAGSGAGGHHGKGAYSKKEEKQLRKFQEKLRKQGKASAPFNIRNNLSKLMGKGGGKNVFRRIE